MARIAAPLRQVDWLFVDHRRGTRPGRRWSLFPGERAPGASAGTGVDTPSFNDSNTSSQWLEVTDPTHALYGREFIVERISHGPESSAIVFVRYGEDIQLRIPLRATSLATLPAQMRCVKLTHDSVEEFLSLVKEYESCQRQLKMSGRRSVHKRNKTRRRR